MHRNSFIGTKRGPNSVSQNEISSRRQSTLDPYNEDQSVPGRRSILRVRTASEVMEFMDLIPSDDQPLSLQDLTTSPNTLTKTDSLSSSTELTSSGNMRKKLPPQAPPKSAWQIDSPLVPFASLHSKYRASLLLRATTSIPQITPAEWLTSNHELQIAAYEGLLLALNRLSSINEQHLNTLVEDIRPQMNIPNKTHQALLTALKSVSTSSSPEYLCSVDFRLQLLRSYVTLSEQHSFEDLKVWRERQCALIFNALLITMLEPQYTACTVDGVKMNTVELLDHTQQLLTQVIVENSQDELDRLLSKVETYLAAVRGDKLHLAFPYPLNVRMYEFLLACRFDSQDGTTLESKADIDDLLNSFRTQYHINNNLHNISLTKSLFEVYQHFIENRQVGMQLKEQLLKLKSSGNAQEDSYQQSVLSQIENWLKEILWDYSRYASRVPIDDFISLYRQLNDENSITEDVFGMILASEYKQYERMVRRPFTVETFTAFVEALTKDVIIQMQLVLPHLLAHSKSPPFMKEFARLYSNDVKYLFKEITNLTLEVADLQARMKTLEDAFLNANIQLVELPNLLDLFSPLVNVFISDQEQVVGGFASRVLEFENFEAISEDQRYSSSVVDIFAMIVQLMPVLFSLTLPALCEFFIGTLGGAVNRTMIKYSEVLSDICNCRKELFPTSEMRKPQKLGRFTLDFGRNSAKQSTIPQMFSPKVASQLANQDVIKLTMRINNLAFARRQLEAFKIDLRQKSQDRNIPIAEVYWDNVFVTSQRSLEKAIVELMRFIGTRVVFFDLRPTLGEVYAPTPEHGPHMEHFLRKLDPLLASGASTVVDDYAKDLATWIFKAVLEGFYYLLFFAAGRTYNAKQQLLFLSELQEIQNFFIAADDSGTAQGIAKAEIVQLSSFVKSLIDSLMSFSSQYLTEQFDAAADTSLMYDSKQIWTKQHILCILLHRDDKIAKQFLNSHHAVAAYKSVRKGSQIFSHKPV
eukprot:TRINITY_DN6332_c0_g1_i1.p1 TRINITY_DN6332_c0_g1~~TRINITY_DN6332_c0_g1_i1.p1  ORF type:complete len:979 (-),score=206.83 TRINITY_DN6332_c0_g1_i1:13-2949(-)